MTRSMGSSPPGCARTIGRLLRATLGALVGLLPPATLADEPAPKSGDGAPGAAAVSPAEARPLTGAATGQPRLGNRPPAKPRQGPVPRPEDPATTVVFGVQGTGSRIVYVIDCSASMASDGGIALDAVRREVAASLDHLHKGNAFAILSYSNVVERFPGGTGEKGFAECIPDKVRRAKDRLERLTAAGNATHAKAIQEALVMKPDVVFVITDSHGRDDIDGKERDALMSLCGKAKIMVAHLASDTSQRCPNLAELAGKSGGRYEAVPFGGETPKPGAKPAAVSSGRTPANGRPAAVDPR